MARVWKAQCKIVAAQSLSEKVCDAGGGEACRELGDLLVERNDGMSAIKAYQKALPLMQRTCVEERQPVSCSLLAEMYAGGLGVPVSKAKAAELHAIACTYAERYCVTP